MRKILYIFSFLLLMSCNSKKNTSSELYVSGYQDEDFNIPSIFFLNFKNDSVFLINENGEIYSAFKKPENKLDSISGSNSKTSLLKTKEFAKYEVFQENKNQWKGYFFKVKEEKNKTSDEFLKVVNNKTFQVQIKKTQSSPNSDLNIYKELKFDNQNITITYHYYYDDILIYSEFETNKYRIIHGKKSLFIQILNNEDIPNRLYEVIKLKNNQFTLVHYAETKAIYEKYKLIQPGLENSNSYKTCNDYRPNEYFNFEAEKRYSKGNKHLLNKITKDAPPTKGNGYITVHFTLNCKDQIGRFGLEQMDMNYKTTKFDKELIKHLITEISKIEDWNSKTKSESDIHTFLMFKIENGKIIDLCP